MNKKTIIFDFDGTIGDTLTLGIEIYNDIAHKFNCKQVELTDVPQLQSKRPREIMGDYNINYFNIPFLLWGIKKELGKRMDEVKAFPDMIETIRELKASGHRVGILTSNSKENVEKFLQINHVTDLFEFIYSGKHVFGKEKTMKKVLKKEGIDNRGVVYVGDETRDVVASKKAGMPIVSVSWGYNNKEALQKLDPEYLVDTTEDLQKAIKRLG